MTRYEEYETVMAERESREYEEACAENYGGALSDDLHYREDAMDDLMDMERRIGRCGYDAYDADDLAGRINDLLDY